MKTTTDALSGIAAEGALLDAEMGAAAVDAAGAVAAVESASNAEEWARLPALFGSVLCIALPQLQTAYSQANCAAWGREMDQVARAYGWNAAGVLAKLGPWLGLIVASLPMLLPTLAAIKEARARGPAPGPEQSVTVTEGARAHPGPLDHGPGMLQPLPEGAPA